MAASDKKDNYLCEDSIDKQVSSLQVLSENCSKEREGTANSECKSRTPSGNAFLNSVADIRHIFSPQKGNKKRKRLEDIESEKVLKQKRGYCSQRLRRVSLRTQRTVNTKTAEKFKDKARQLASGHTPTRKRVNKQTTIEDFTLNHSDSSFTTTDNSSFDQEKSEISDVSTEFLTQLSQTLKTIPDPEIMSTKGEDAKEITKTDADLGSSEVNMMEIETNGSANPTTMDVRSVAELMMQVKTEMAGIRSDIAQIQNNQETQVSDHIIDKCTDSVLNKLDNVESKNATEVTKIKEELRQVKFRNRTLADIVDRLSVEVTELRIRADNADLYSAKKSVSLSGFYSSDKRDDAFVELQNFFEQYLGLIVNIEDFYKIGNASPKLTIITFQTMQEKRDVLRFKSHLKGCENKDGKQMYINDYIPAATLERRKRERQIIQDCQESGINTQFYKGRLAIQGELLKPKIIPPSPKQLINIPPDELSNILKIPTTGPTTIAMDMSIFHAYTAEVSSFQEIRDLYVKVKLMQPDARHIVCAYRIPGNEKHYCEDFCDDDEPGGGQTLLSLLQAQRYQSRVVFVARKFGGIKMGAERFRCYSDAAKKAIEEAPKESVKVDPHQPVNSENKPGDDKPTRGAVRGNRYIGLRGRPANRNAGPKNSASKMRGQFQPQRTQYRDVLRFNPRGQTGRHFRRGQQAYRRNCNEYPHPRLSPQRSRYYDEFGNPQGQSFRDNNDWEYGVSQDWSTDRDANFYKNRQTSSRRSSVDF